MVLKAMALALSVVVSTEVAITAHESLSGSTEPALASFGERIMPMDEANDLRKATTDADHADTHLKAALEKNPYRTGSWVELSVAKESSGDLEGAKKSLAEATEHDAGAEPRWAEANFYFRQGDKAKFIEAVNQYRSVTHKEEPGLFRMVAESTGEVHALLLSMPNLGCDELGTLLGTIHERDMRPDELVDRMAASCHDDASGKALGHYMSDLLREDKAGLAGEVKTRLGDNDTVVNSFFTSPVTGEGFDWRVNVNDNIHVAQEGKQGIRFDFEDRVPSGTVLLFQPIALPQGDRYRLSMKLDSNPQEDEAFRWELVELATGRRLSSGLDEENINKRSAWMFQVPKTNKTLAIALFYRRTEGELPFQGTIQVEGVRLARELPMAPLGTRQR